LFICLFVYLFICLFVFWLCVYHRRIIREIASVMSRLPSKSASSTSASGAGGSGGPETSFFAASSSHPESDDEEHRPGRVVVRRNFGVLVSNEEFHDEVTQLIRSFSVFRRSHYHVGYFRTFIENRGRGCFYWIFEEIPDLHDDALHTKTTKLPWKTVDALCGMFTFQLPTSILQFLTHYNPYELAPILFIYNIRGYDRVFFAIKVCGREAVDLDPCFFHGRPSIVDMVMGEKRAHAHVVTNAECKALVKDTRPSVMAPDADLRAFAKSQAMQPGKHIVLENNDPLGIMRVAFSRCFACGEFLTPHFPNTFVRCNTCTITLFCNATCMKQSSHCRPPGGTFDQAVGAATSSTGGASLSKYCMGKMNEMLIKTTNVEAWIVRQTKLPLELYDRFSDDVHADKTRLQQQASVNRVAKPFHVDDYKKLIDQQEFDDEDEVERPADKMDHLWDKMMQTMGQLHLRSSGEPTDKPKRSSSGSSAAAASSSAASSSGVASGSFRTRPTSNPSNGHPRSVVPASSSSAFTPDSKSLYEAAANVAMAAATAAASAVVFGNAPRVAANAAAATAAAAAAATAASNQSQTETKRKRGRPRKSEADSGSKR
jgi:hypothetical protein